jgi:hypothetical protein
MTISRTQPHTLQKQACIGLVSLCVLLSMAYIYFISASIVHVVIRTETNQEVKKIGSEISLLEGRFIEAQHRVSSDIASLQGYTQTSNKVFIDRSAPAFVLSDGSTR